MNGSFLDTTFVVELANSTGTEAAERYLAKHLPAHMPHYAIRELLTGLIRVLCDAHNKLRAAEDPGEALLAFASLPAVVGRRKNGGIQVIAQELTKAFQQNPNGRRSGLKKEMLQSLKLKVGSLWKQARRPKLCSVVQSLGCLNSGELMQGDSGELRGPNGSFNCLQHEKCAAAAYLYQDKIALNKLIDALHPRNLDSVAAEKRENASRRKALKHLRDRGPRDFNKNRCRALGDAYFAAMCPPGMSVLTSNIVDLGHLCLALGKQAVKYP